MYESVGASESGGGNEAFLFRTDDVQPAAAGDKNVQGCPPVIVSKQNVALFRITRRFWTDNAESHPFSLAMSKSALPHYAARKSSKCIKAALLGFMAGSWDLGHGIKAST